MPFDNENKLSRGRPAGSPNKVTIETREFFNLLLQSKLEQLNNDLEAMTPRWRVHYILELAKFVMPTLKAVDITANDQEEPRIFTVNIVRNNEDNE